MKKLLTVTCLAGLLSIPSVVFADEAEMPAEPEISPEMQGHLGDSHSGASWYGSIRAGVQSSGGNTSGFDGLSRFGVIGSNEISEGLSAVYQFEHKLNSTNASLGGGGRLSYVGLSGGFGTITAGQIWSATHKIVGFTDKSNFFGSNGGSGRHGNAVSYAMSSGAMSMQMDAVFNGAATHPSNVDQLEFGVSMNIGEIGKIAFAHRKIEDSEKAISVTYNTGLDVLLDKTSTAVVTGVDTTPTAVVTGVDTTPTAVVTGVDTTSTAVVTNVDTTSTAVVTNVDTTSTTVVTGVSNKLKAGWTVTPDASLTLKCTPDPDSTTSATDCGTLGKATASTVTYKYLAKKSKINLSGELAGDIDVATLEKITNKKLKLGSGTKANGTNEPNSAYVWTLGQLATENNKTRPGAKQLTDVKEYRYDEAVKVSIEDENKPDGTDIREVNLRIEKTYDDGLPLVTEYHNVKDKLTNTEIAKVVIKKGNTKDITEIIPIQSTLTLLTFKDVTYVPGDLPDQGSPIVADPTTETVVGSVTPTAGTAVGSVTPTAGTAVGTVTATDGTAVGTVTATDGTAVGSVTATNGTALSDVDGSKSTATTTIGTTPETMGVTNMMKVHGSTTNYIAGQISYGGVTGHLGFSAQKINDGSKSDATYAGVSGAIGDTGMSYVVQMIRQKQADNNPWVVAVNKSLGGGATLIFEHSNPDSAVNSTSAIALQVGF